MRALGVAITSSVLGTSLVVGVLGCTTIGVHLDEVESAIETARKLRNIDIEGELLVEWLEDLVTLVGGVHQVDTRTDVLGASGCSDELVGDRITAGSDTIGTRVVGTIDSAVLSASNTIRAEGSIPRVTGVAVGVAGCGVEPTPVGIEDDGRRLSCAATGFRTLLPSELRMDLSCLGTDLLSRGKGEKGEREECGSGGHDDCFDRGTSTANEATVVWMIESS